MGKRKRKPGPPEHIGDVFSRIMADITGGRSASLDRLYASWDRVVGPEMAALARPGSFGEGILVVTVASAPVSQSLSYEKARIISELNRAVDAPLVKDIRFSVGTIPKTR